MTNLLLKQRLIVLRRARRRAPNLTLSDRLIYGFGSLFLNRGRIRKLATILRPSTLLAFHQALVRRKYRRLFSSTSCPREPGPKGPDQALIQAIVELKSRKPRFGCPRIARIISQTFGIDVDKNGVYRVLAKHYRPAPGGSGPSWLSFIGHTTDSLWSLDLFRCESILLRSYWVLVVMDQFTRRLVGIGVHGGAVTGADVCRMFNAAIHGQGVPRHLSTDHDPLFEAHRWMANLRILDIDEIKTVPHVPLPHPFVERLIGTMRREFLDHVLFWNGRDLERKLAEFQAYYNAARCHASLDGHTPLDVRRRKHGGPCRSEPAALGVLGGVRTAHGLRRGELFALRWWDIDELNHSFRVRTAVYEGVFDDPKTTACLRTIPLPDAALELLTAWKARATRTAAQALIFSTVSGKPISPNNVLRRWVWPACQAADLQRVTWLTFRRTYSSWAHDKGVPAKVVAQIMGHTKIDTTMNVYTQVLDGAARSAADRVGSELFRVVQIPDGTTAPTH